MSQRSGPDSSRASLWWILGVLAVIIGGVVALRWSDGPAEVVEDYMEAVVAGDVDRALTYVSDPPYGDRAALLRSDVIADDWELVDVTSGDDSTGRFVTARISHANDEWDLLFRMIERGPTWVIANPFAELTVDSFAFGYLQVNGHVVDLSAMYDRNQVTAGWSVFPVFPGPYTFFDDVDGADVAPVSLIAQPVVTNVTTTVEMPEFTPTDETDDAAKKMIRDWIDHCGGSTVGDYPPCLFYVDEDRTPVTELHDITWETVDYPQVNVGAVDAGTSVPYGTGLPLHVTDPGLTTATASGIVDGATVTVHIECLLRDGLDVVLHADGRFTPARFGAGLIGATDYRQRCEIRDWEPA